MKRKTVLLALLDSIPVLSYGITMLLIALRFPSPPFMAGAAVSVLAGVFKLASKIAGATHNLRWLKKTLHTDANCRVGSDFDFFVSGIQ